jgi:hypothetical protein
MLGSDHLGPACVLEQRVPVAAVTPLPNSGPGSCLEWGGTPLSLCYPLYVEPLTVNEVSEELVLFQVPSRPGVGLTLAPAATAPL